MSSKNSPEISGANFPALRSFLRGYFHEDMADEYGSPEEAADAFCEDAIPMNGWQWLESGRDLMNWCRAAPLPKLIAC